MTPDVVVVGGGAIGVCVASELARRGAAVTLLERGPRLASGCSAGNAGLICPSHATPLATPAALRQGVGWMLRRDSPFRLRPRLDAAPWLVRFVASCRAGRAADGTRAIRELSVASLDLHARLAEQGLATGFERRGTLGVYETEAGLEAGTREARQAGLPVRVLSPDDARELEPALGDGIVGAVYYPREGHCDPAAFVDAVGAQAADAGAEIRTGVEVRSLRRHDGRVALGTSEGVLSPETIVLAAGAWTTLLARHVRVFLPLEGGKGYHVDLEAAGGDPSVPVFAQEARAVATPLAGRLRLSGTLELAGLDLGIDHSRVAAMRRALARVLRGQAGRRVVDVWAGLRPCTPDGLPVIGYAAGLDGLVLATGHAMKGLALAPITGRLVAQLVAGEDPDHDLAPFRPDRFRPLLPRRA
jgi:D-amino-acid dehydrogenase